MTQFKFFIGFFLVAAVASVAMTIYGIYISRQFKIMWGITMTKAYGWNVVVIPCTFLTIACIAVV